MNNLIDEAIDVHLQQDFTLKTMVKKFPPKEKELFDKWLKTTAMEDFSYKWEYLSSLNIKDYLRMYARLPDLLIDEYPESGSAKHKLFEEHKQRYLASSLWLNQLMDYSTPNYKEMYKSEGINLYRYDANTSMAQLDLCRAIVRHPEYSLDKLWATPIYLWFWIQVATTIQWFKVNGLTTPVSIEDIQGKREVHNKLGEVIEYCQGIPVEHTAKCKSFPDFLLNIPAVLTSIVRKLQKAKYDSMLQNALDNYVDSQMTRREFTKECPEIQVASIYQSKPKSRPKPESKPESDKLFVSGSRQKRPKC